MENIFNYISEDKFKKKSYKKGDVIYSEGEVCDNFSIIAKGQVIISTFTQTEKEYAINVLSSGSTFGELLLFSNFDCYLGNIIATRDTTILNINKKDLLTELHKSKDLMLFFLELISSEAMALQTRNKILLQNSIRDKILFYLNERKKLGEANEFYIDSKESLARYLNIPRPSLSRELISMKDDGIIDFDRHFIYLKEE